MYMCAHYEFCFPKDIEKFYELHQQLSMDDLARCSPHLDLVQFDPADKNVSGGERPTPVSAWSGWSAGSSEALTGQLRSLHFSFTLHYLREIEILSNFRLSRTFAQ